MRFIILRLEGGLGNQLFQYAFARSMQKKYNGKIIFDTHSYKKDPQRSKSLDNFILNDNVVIKNNNFIECIIIIIRIYKNILVRILKFIRVKSIYRLKILLFFGLYVQESSNYVNNIGFCASPFIYIHGNWMSENYFKGFSDLVKEDLKGLTKLRPRNLSLARKMKNENSICIHIRRGDYTNSTWSAKLLVCNFEYYKKAIELIVSCLKEPIFYIFSNNSEDIQWIKNNYRFNNSLKINYIDLKNSDYQELMLMKECKHFILSNSSFSWWASYLNEYSKSIVVAPSRWNNNIWDLSDIYRPNWKIITI